MRPDDDRSQRPEDIFRALRGRESPEIDPEASWRRLRAALPERSQPTAWVAFWRYGAAAAAAVLVVAMALWQGGVLTGPAEQPGGVVAESAGETPATPAGDRDLVLLAGTRPEDAAPAAAEPAEAPGALRLDVRLLRAGAADAPALGAGGADATADIDATLRAVLPDRDYGIVGRWQGELASGDMETSLAPGHRLSFVVDPADPRTLRRVRLVGESEPLVADEIRLDPGQVYVFGVRDAEGATDVLLAVRVERVPATPDSDR